MTAPEILPVVDARAAITLYELEEALMLCEASRINKCHHHDNNSPPSHGSNDENATIETAAWFCTDADAGATDPTEVYGSCRSLAIEMEDSDLDRSNTTTAAGAATSTAACSPQQLSSLQQRCLSAIAEYWNKINCKVLRFLNERPGYVAVEVFMQVLLP